MFRMPNSVRIYIKNKINNFFNHFSNPEIGVFGMKINTFLLLGCIGFLTGGIIFIFLSYAFELQIVISLLILGSCTIAFFTFTFLYKIITGNEEYIFFKHLFIVYLSSIVTLLLFKQSILPYMDLLSYGIAAAAAIGRIGCLQAGCCYGRPGSPGILYSNKYRKQGIPGCFINKRLLPVQFIECILFLLICGSGVFFILPFFPPGTGVLYFLICCSVIRFFMEFKRGDVIRKYLFLMSLNQWACFLLLLLLNAFQLLHVLPFLLPVFCISLFLLIGLLLIIIVIHSEGKQFALLLPGHICEIISILDSFPDLQKQETVNSEHDLSIKKTSKGFIISKGVISREKPYYINYSFSHEKLLLKGFLVHSIKRLILSTVNAPAQGKLIKGKNRVFHLLTQLSHF